MFDEFLTERVTLLKQDGQKRHDIMASVQQGSIFIQRNDILIESGDLVKQTLSNGAEDTYKVIDPNFREAFHDISAGYELKVQKLGIPEAVSAVASINNTFHISGNNNRVNQSSIDNSINVVNDNTELFEHIEALRTEVSRLDLSMEERKSSYEVIDAIQAQCGSDSPSKTVVQTLLTGLPHAASIASIGSFIMSVLGG